MSRSFRAQRFACGACEDDVEGELVSGQLRCLVCGSVLVAQETHQQQQAGERSPLPGGNNVADALEQLMNRLGPSKAASKRSVASLRRVRPDARSCTLDPQVRLRVEGIEGDCIAVPASFGPLLAPPEEREYSLRECVPRFAETMEIKSNLRDAWALVDRGGDVSFAFKVRACEAAGALGVVLVQTQEVWPFTPTDVKGEAAQWNDGLTIPLIAVSKATGTRLRELLRLQQEGPSLGMKIRLSLLVGESDRMCAVCHDDLVDKTTAPPSELVQMPCLHYFHAHCVMPWLENNNTCPVCRFALETDIATTSSAATPQNDTPSILGWFG